ncbi:hypothetical protein UT300007_14120 [Clostridium sp. CTA-7]
MKKFILSLTIISIITLVGCNSNTSESKIKDLESEITSLKEEVKEKDELIASLQTNNKQEKEITEESANYLSEGEVFIVKSELGEYEFRVLEANYIAPRQGNPKSFVQIVWEVNNISFNGREEDPSGKKIDEGFCQVGVDALKVKDDDNYILDSSSSAYENEHSNEYQRVYKGEKVKQKYIWELNEDNTDYVYVSFPRMENKEYKLKINR